MPRAWRTFLVGWALLAAAFLWLQRSSFVVGPGDEGTYLYQGALVARGALPYRDFFLAHPPLRVLLPGATIALGLGPVAAKALAPLSFPVIALAAGATVLPTLGAGPALAAAALLLTSGVALRVGGSYLGVEIAAALTSLAMLALSRRRPATAGALCAVAGFQALHGLGALPVLALWAWREKGLARFAAGFALLPALFAVTTAVCGLPFLDQVLLYHLRKVGHDPNADPGGALRRFLAGDVALLALAVAGAARGTGAARWAAFAGLAATLLLAVYPSLIGYYFVVALPFLAAGGAGAVAALRDARPKWLGRSGRELAALAVGAAALAAVAPGLRDAWKRDDWRRADLEEMDRLVARVARCRPASGTIFGDRGVVPRVALRLDLAIAAREVDTDSKRFNSGLARASDVLDRALAPPRPAVLLLADHGISLIPGVVDRVEADHALAFAMPAPALGREVRYFLPPDEAARAGRCDEGPR